MLSLSLAASIPAARADDGVFDFVATRPGQQGMYVIGVGALMSGGLGTLAPVAGWFDEGWHYRFALAVDNPGAALSEWPVPLDIDAATAAGYDVFQLARANGADLRLVQGGAPLDRVSFGHWDLAENRGRVWFQLADVPAGTSNLALYFGNQSAGMLDDPAAVFSYSAPYAGRYALEPEGAALAVVSSMAGNSYSVGALSGTLGAGEVASVDPAAWQSGLGIASSAPLEVGYVTDGASEAAPVSFARRLHAVVVNRGLDNTFTVLAPHADASVDIAINGATVATLSLTQGVADTFVQDLATNDVISFSATSPVLVAHRTVDNLDGHVLPPPVSEVWGVRSGTPRILAVDSDAEVTWYDSTGASGVVTIPAGGFATLTAGGSGTGDALRLMARDPATGDPARVTVVGTADGDGGDSIVFHPAAFLGRQWTVPTDGRFVLIATAVPTTTCVLTPPDGSPAIVQTSQDTVIPPWPGRVKFGADTGVNVLAGSLIECDGHGFAYYEDAATDDERNLYPWEAHQKATAQPPSVSFGASLMTRYLAGTVALIETPDLVAPTGVVAWTDFRVAASEPAGSSVRFQVSVDEGRTWLISNGVAWILPPDAETGNTGNEIRDNLGGLDPSEGRLRVRVILLSEDGVSRPSVDAVRVFYTPVAPASHLSFDTLGPSYRSGVGFEVGISVLNPDGAHVTGYSGEATLSASHGGQVTPSRIWFENGRADFQVAVGGTADDVTLRAETVVDGLSGFSAPFDLTAVDGYSLEAVSGDNQFGLVDTELAEPLVVRIVGPTGAAARFAQVTFAILEGGGRFEPDGMASYAVQSDEQGLAQVRLRLGPDKGAQRVRVEAAGATLELVARADLPGDAVPESEGCCNTRRPAPGPGSVVLLVFVVVCTWRRRARC